MTFTEYDELVDRLHENKYSCDDWWPTPDEIKEKNGWRNQHQYSVFGMDYGNE